MPKYRVWQERAYVFYQDVEADDKAQAITLAEQRSEWEPSESQSDIVTHYEVEQT